MTQPEVPSGVANCHDRDRERTARENENWYLLRGNSKIWSRHQYLFFMGKTLEKPKNLVCEENHLGSGVGYA